MLPRVPPESDPSSWDPEPAFNEDGVDLTQVRAALARTPLERLQHHEASANSLRWMLRVAVRVPRSDVEAV